MTIPASKVKSVCTSAEAKLVRTSRKPELEELTPAKLRQHIARTRQLVDKWQDLARGQSRARNRKVGFGDVDPNTQLKAEIFRDALASFEARLAKLDRAPAATAKGAKSKKKVRAVKHRMVRAEVRKELAEVKGTLAAPGRAAAAPVARMKKVTVMTGEMPMPLPTAPAAAAPASAAPVSVASVPAARSRTKVVTAKIAPPKATKVNPAKQRAAVTAAKQTRVLKSGKTTRMRGHMIASGKRTQARRDSK